MGVGTFLAKEDCMALELGDHGSTFGRRKAMRP